MSLDQLLRAIVAGGFFLPLTPITRSVTVGGATAAYMHGKNHHVDGSFGIHVHPVLLVEGSGTLRELTPSGRGSVDEAQFFWATAVSIGLMGVIVESMFALIPITSSVISVDTTRYRDLESLMELMVEIDADRRAQAPGVMRQGFASGRAPDSHPDPSCLEKLTRIIREHQPAVEGDKSRQVRPHYEGDQHLGLNVPAQQRRTRSAQQRSWSGGRRALP